jgi:NAD(P)-dependent dehydrogenase (short-subunit alcohol dehydrogenase family)
MATPYFETKDNIEGQLATNHFGPFLFTNLILPRIFASTTGEPRIDNVSSNARHFSPIIFEGPAFFAGETYDKWVAYGQSKTGNSLFAKELSDRYKTKGLLAYSLNPGSIDTNLQRHIDREAEMKTGIQDYNRNEMMTPEFLKHLVRKTLSQGASTVIAAAFNLTIKVGSGLYLDNARIDNESVKEWALNKYNSNRLWA